MGTMHRTMITMVLRTVAVAFGAQLAAAPVYAQAWLPAKGEGSVSVLFSSMLMDEHMWPAGTGGNPNLGRMESNALLFDLTYGVSDRIAVSVSLPVVTSRYTGSNPHLGRLGEPSPIDDGAWHTTGQDFRFNVRYNVWTGPVVVTPFVGSVVPSHGYDHYGHASPGRNLPEVPVAALPDVEPRPRRLGQTVAVAPEEPGEARRRAPLPERPHRLA